MSSVCFCYKLSLSLSVVQRSTFFAAFVKHGTAVSKQLFDWTIADLFFIYLIVSIYQTVLMYLMLAN